MGIYDRYLAARLRLSDGSLPERVALVITERDLLEPGAYDTLASFLEWAFDLGASHITVSVSVLDADAVPTLRRALEDPDTPHEVAVRGPEDDEPADAPEAIDEAEIEERLLLPAAPDLLIKTGAERLSDFMIWQSVYSELYFTDVNWRDFRRRDYLRALREYQERQRRFGR